MLKLAAKRPLEQWGSPSQCSPGHRFASTPLGAGAGGMGGSDCSPSPLAVGCKRMRMGVDATSSPGAFGFHGAAGSMGDQPSAHAAAFGCAAAAEEAAQQQQQQQQQQLLQAQQRFKRSRRLDGGAASPGHFGAGSGAHHHDGGGTTALAGGASGMAGGGSGMAGTGMTGSLFFGDGHRADAGAGGGSPVGGVGSAAAAAATVAAAAAATPPGSLAALGPGTSFGGQSPPDNGRTFSLAELKQIVQRALEVREVQLRQDYDRVLQARLQEQFESFTRYHEDYVSRQLKQSEFSYMS